MRDFLKFHLFFEDEKNYEDLPDNTLIYHLQFQADHRQRKLPKEWLEEVNSPKFYLLFFMRDMNYIAKNIVNISGKDLN